jgi:hypothetical protein
MNHSWSIQKSSIHNCINHSFTNHLRILNQPSWINHWIPRISLACIAFAIWPSQGSHAVLYCWRIWRRIWRRHASNMAFEVIAGGQNHHADIDAHARTCPCIWYSKLIDTNCRNKNIWFHWPIWFQNDLTWCFLHCFFSSWCEPSSGLLSPPPTSLSPAGWSYRYWIFKYIESSRHFRMAIISMPV